VSLACNVLHTVSYLAELLNRYVPAHTLLSSSSANLHVSDINLSFDSHSHVPAPIVWNFLPSSICSSKFWIHCDSLSKRIGFSLLLTAPIS